MAVCVSIILIQGKAKCWTERFLGHKSYEWVWAPLALQDDVGNEGERRRWHEIGAQEA